MTKRNSQSQQPMWPALSNQQVRLHVGSFASEAWAVLSQCRTYRAHADPDRARMVAHMLWHSSEDCGGSLAVLGWTECGQPRHPLRAPKDTTPECLTLDVDSYGLHEAEDPRWERLLAGEA